MCGEERKWLRVCVCDEACEGTLGTLILSLLVQTANCVSQPVCGERERETRQCVPLSFQHEHTTMMFDRLD